jgi:hypothetical protein
MEISKVAKALSQRDPELHEVVELYEEAFQIEVQAIGLVPVDFKWRPMLVHTAALLAQGAGRLEDRDRLFHECNEMVS